VSEAGSAKGSASEPRFRHPKILAVDLAEEDVETIRAAGHNVRAGSFGTPVSVERSADYHPVPVNGALPNLAEQEVVVIDLTPPPPRADLPLGEAPVGKGIWQQADRGEIEPRPRLMAMAREDLDRIYAHGGVFVVFAQPRLPTTYRLAFPRYLGSGEDLETDTWAFLGAVAGLGAPVDLGEEVLPGKEVPPRIRRALEASEGFRCVLQPDHYLNDRWFSLATSKYGGDVAGILFPEEDSGAGWVIVLPLVPDKGALVGDLLTDFLPRLAPKLFPEDERQAWADDDLSAPPGVAALRAEISGVRESAEKKVAELEGEIETLRSEGAHLRDLLTATGSELVAAVKTTLESLGFVDVRDVDATEGIKEGRLGEDLQIHVPSPVVLCEVKGINGLPRDEDALEVVKYILPRIDEWDRSDVRGLTIVNHQRGLPPSERDPNVFQGDQVKNAEGQRVGLLTTLDLFRLARGLARNGWRHEDLAPLFTATAGRVPALPLHYTRVGQVHNYLPDKGVVIVELSEGRAVALGERLGFIGEVEFAEEEISSIQFEDEQVETSPKEGRIGLKTALGKDELRKGTPVHRVASPALPSG
jgi:hypothetical protein